MLESKKDVKVKKEEGMGNMKENERHKKVVVDVEEKEKKKKEEQKKQKENEEEKQKAWKDKEAKDNEDKEKAMKNNKAKKKEEKEKSRKDKEATNKEEKDKVRTGSKAKEKEKVSKDKETRDKEEKEKEKSRKDDEAEDKEEKQEEDEQKERKKQKEREENDKDKNICPHFYKVFIPELSTEQLRIPLAFNKYLEDQSLGVVSLKGPSGNIWRTELVANSKELCFVHGWKEFVSDHCINLGYFLVFRYDGPSEFSVQVFDQTACEMQYAFLARPRNDAVIEDDEEDVGSRADDTLQDDVGNMGNNESDTSKEDDEWHMDSGNALDTSHDDRGDMGRNADGASKDNDIDMGIGITNTTKTLVLRDENETMRKVSRKPDGAIGRKYRKIDELMANDYPSKKCKADDKMYGASSSACKKVPSSISNSFQDSAASSLVMPNKTPSYHKFMRLRSTLLNNSNDAPQPGKAVTKVQRRSSLISQRRPTNEKETDHVVQRAMNFESKRPFTWKTMKYCEVYAAFFMTIPYAFVQKHLPKYSRKMTLWDPQGKSWGVSYVYFGDRSSAAFSAGWGMFAVANNLEKSDACVFELLDKDYNIKVHIFRVIREITPCIPSSDAS